LKSLFKYKLIKLNTIPLRFFSVTMSCVATGIHKQVN